MKGKVLGVFENVFKDGSKNYVIVVEKNNALNKVGVVCQPFNISIENFPAKSPADLVGKEVIVPENGYPKYTWCNEIYLV